MDKKVLVVANTEGIIVRGLEAKLKGQGLETVFVTPKMSELQHGLDRNGLRDALAAHFAKQQVMNG